MKSFSLVALLLCLLVAVPFSVAQDSSPAPIPDSHELASSDLIAWSGMQSPQPVPPSGQQPLGPDPQTETQPQANPAPSPATAPTTPAASSAQSAEQNQTPATRTFLGTISKQSDFYVLRTESSSYKLDAQDRAKQFDGQKVQVIGILNTDGQSIQVQSIDPVP